jgi:anti-sigma regulatory factor (Ser/Thr protein kinase)
MRVKLRPVNDDQPGERSEQAFPRSCAALDEVFAFTAAFYLRAGIADEDRFSVDFAVEEVFTNVVRHGSASSRAVTIALERAGDRLRVVIVDPDSDAFDLVAAPDARTDAPLDEREPGGLGIHLTRRLMDGMDYTHTGRTSTVTLTKKLR